MTGRQPGQAGRRSAREVSEVWRGPAAAHSEITACRLPSSLWVTLGWSEAWMYPFREGDEFST